MRIVVKVENSEGSGFGASCAFDGFQASLRSAERWEAIAAVRRLVFAHFGTLEQPPRCVEFDVVDGGVEVLG